MKERFEKRRLTGKISVNCKSSNGVRKVWKAEKEDVVNHIVNIVERYEQMGYRLTLRQLHYQFVSHVPGYINEQEAYKKLGRILDDCRYAGVIDWDSITDRGRRANRPYFEHGPRSALERTAELYRVDRQRNQKTHVEVWTEKDALSEIFEQSTNKYGITLSINKGYTSSSAIYLAYSRFCDRIIKGQDVVILYFGDHDPSGLDMIRDIQERLYFMFTEGQYNIDPDSVFQIIPIGLTMKQVKRYKLPPNPAKMTDTRSPAYIKKFGKTCWEVDALNPEVLTQILETNILEHIDAEDYASILRIEQDDKNQLRSLIKKIK